ncbi:MAG: hypothetical protein CM15mV148_120 [uncultured marine virus]|nr:MAG: hypothetical protein CM15mV148_120 [uncultured marine virus]
MLEILAFVTVDDVIISSAAIALSAVVVCTFKELAKPGRSVTGILRHGYPQFIFIAKN